MFIKLPSLIIKYTRRVMIIITIISAIAGLVVFSILPAQIPRHFMGLVVRPEWGLISKNGMFLFNLSPLLFWVYFFIPWEKKRDTNEGILTFALISIFVTIVVIYALFVIWSIDIQMLKWAGII